MQDVAAQGATQVLTPFGYRDSTKAHRVPEGYELIRMPDTHIRMHNPKPMAADQQRVPFTDNDWITFASWYNNLGKPISYFGTDWSAPPNPQSYTGQTLFQFNSIEPASRKRAQRSQKRAK